MNVLLTGATGFLGNEVFEELRETKNKIICLVRKTSDITKIEDRCELRYGDLLDLSSLKKALKGIDVLVNVAASTPERELSGNYEGNTIGVKNLVEACRHNKVDKILHISSISVIFPIKTKYNVTKLESEKIIKKSKAGYVIFRPTGIYGEDSNDFRKIVRLYSRFPFAVILGNGKHKLRPVYVKDVAKAVKQYLDKGKFDNKIYNIAGPESFEFSVCVDKICEVIGKKPLKIYIPKTLLMFIARLLEIFFPEMKVSPERVNIMFQDRNVSIEDARRDFLYSPEKYEDTIRKIIPKIR